MPRRPTPATDTVLTYVVEGGSAGERLDRFLAGREPERSRARLQGLIRDGRVCVNGRVARAAQRLKGGDRVELTLPPPRVTTLEPEPIPLCVVWSDESLMVIDKPAGMVVHPGAGAARGTLVHALLHLDPAIASVGGAGRPGIVHRLDKDTSGLLLVARTERAHRALVEAMQSRLIHRVYQALVWGDLPEAVGTVERPIGRDPRHRQRMAVLARGGRPARTHWRALRRWGVATRLEVTLDTGRTHQIRVHLAHLGHPVLGDPVYGGRSKKLLSLAGSQRSLTADLLRVMSRQALHAFELRLAHPLTGEKLRFESPLPDDFTEALHRLDAVRPSGEDDSRR